MSSISRLPSLTGESSYSSKTATNSPFASGLTTPNDEEPNHILFIEGETPRQLGDFESQQTFRKHARKGPLFRAVSKAREAAKSVFETPKRLKKRQPVVTQGDVTNRIGFEETPGTPGDAFSHRVRGSTEAVHRMIMESPSIASPALASAGSFGNLESAATPCLPRPLSFGCQQRLEIDPTRGEDSLKPAPRSIQWLLQTFILAICFPLWTFAVGGCILLSPTTHLDVIAFGSGFVPLPLSDIARFGYWAENAIPHMCTFLAGLCFLIWWRLDLGFSVLAIVFCLFWRAWSRFELDKDIPLGADDQQTIYLISMVHTLGGGHRFKTNDGYLMDLPPGVRLNRLLRG